MTSKHQTQAVNRVQIYLTTEVAFCYCSSQTIFQIISNTIGNIKKKIIKFIPPLQPFSPVTELISVSKPCKQLSYTIACIMTLYSMHLKNIFKGRCDVQGFYLNENSALSGIFLMASILRHEQVHIAACNPSSALDQNHLVLDRLDTVLYGFPGWFI